MDPYLADDIETLREAIRQCQNELNPFQTQFRKRMELYCGGGYGANEENIDTPFNVFNLALRVYNRRLVSGSPRVLIRARNQNGRTAAYELELACEQLMREINFVGTVKEAVQQALMVVGIVKVGLVPAELEGAEGFFHDAEQPFCDPILFEDFAFDTAAKRWEEIDWCGNRFRIPLEDVMDNPLYDWEGVETLATADNQKDEDFKEGVSDDESVKRLGSTDTIANEELREYVTLWEIWLPREQVIVTIAERGGPALRVVEWTGPEGGPYHLLCFDPVPGNILPTAPGSHLENMSNLINEVMRKLGDQVTRQKKNPVFPKGNEEAVNALVEAGDGEALEADQADLVKEVSTGGIDPPSYAFFMSLREIYNYLSGNIDSAGGLRSSADTLGQERILMQGAAGMVEDLQDSVTSFIKRISTDLSWYLHSDPTSSRQLVKEVPGTDISLPFYYTPERRGFQPPSIFSGEDVGFQDNRMNERMWFLFEFDVDPYSLHVRTPAERLEMLLKILPMTAQMAQVTQAMQMLGGTFEIEEAWRTITRYTGLTELGSWFKFYGEPLGPEPGQQAASGPHINMPLQTERTYTRQNVGSGSLQVPQQQLMAQMMQGGGNGQSEARF